MEACKIVSIEHLLDEMSLGLKEPSIHDLQLGHVLKESAVVIDEVLLVRPFEAVSDCLLDACCQLTESLGNFLDVGIMQEVIARLNALKERVHVSQPQSADVFHYCLQDMDRIHA
jgi:hypothetical protein